MKSRISIPPQYKRQVQEQIQGEVMEYLDNVKREISRRLCYASILALDDGFRNRFGQKDETLNRNYQRFATMLQDIIHGYNRDCYEWEHSTDPEAISKAMHAELLDRGIEVEFE